MVFALQLLALVLGSILGLVAILALVLTQISRRYKSLEDSQDLEAKVGQLAERYLKKRDQHALAIGVIAHGEVRVFTYGKVGRNLERETDQETRFEIASITKLFTALAMQRLVDEGQADWDQTLDVLDIDLPPEIGKITLAQLATHASGLPRLPSNIEEGGYREDDPYAHYDRSMLEAYLKDAKLKFPPGKKSAYSNLGMGLLGHVVAKIAATDYPTAVGNLVLDPLEMPNTGAKFPEHMENCAIPRTKKGDPVPPWEMNALAGCGCLKSSVSELLKFLAVAMDPDQNNAVGRAMSETRSKRFSYFGQQIGYGWQFTALFTGDLGVWWHNGGTAGSISYLGVIPEHQVAVVSLCNSGDAFARDTSLDRMSKKILVWATKISWS